MKEKGLEYNHPGEPKLEIKRIGGKMGITGRETEKQTTKTLKWVGEKERV